jgi:O-phosphoseryl-tRNA(Cys) synthetase
MVREYLVTYEVAQQKHPSPVHLQAYEEPFRRSEQMDGSSGQCAFAQGCVLTNLLCEQL